MTNILIEPAKVCSNSRDPGNRLQSSFGCRLDQDQIQEFLGLLSSYNPKDEAQMNRMAQLVYPDLRRIAGGLLRNERNIGVSMQATMLASDSIMRLMVRNRVEAKDFPHFLSIAATAMRQMLKDHIRRKRAQKRPSSVQRVEMEDNLALSPQAEEFILALDEAIEQLEPESREMLVMFYFGGASLDDLAARFDVSVATVKRRLNPARLRVLAKLKSKKAAKA